MDNLPAWRDAALILLALQFFVVCLPIAVAGYYSVRYLRVLRRWLAGRFPIWQASAVRGRDYVDQYAGYAVRPVVGLASLMAAVASISRLGRPKATSGWRSYYE